MDSKTIAAEQLQEKWNPILEHGDMPKIEDSYRKRVTAILLENQEKQSWKQPTLSVVCLPSSSVKVTSRVTTLFLSRSFVVCLPNLIAYDICGVQPLTGPTGLIFAMKSRYQNQTGAEALYNEARTSFSGNTGAERTTNLVLLQH